MTDVLIERVDFFPEAHLVRMAGNQSTGVISITEPERRAPLNEDRWGAVLRLGFHDVDTTKYSEEENEELRETGYTLFTEEHARIILEWLNKYEDKLYAIYVHCAMGISRSAAVALFVAERYRLPIDDWKTARYNKHVYRTLFNEWTKDPEIQKRILEERERTV